MGNSTAKLANELNRVHGHVPPTVDRVRVAGIDVCALTEDQVVSYIVAESKTGRGGWVVTPNVDICHKVRADSAIRDLVNSATLIVPDGMPLVWAARIAGQFIPERVSGSSLIYTLSWAAADSGLSVYFLGGAPGVPEKAAMALNARYPALRVAGTDAPRSGFDKSSTAMFAIIERIRCAQPDIVFVGMGFPKQEQLIAQLTAVFPGAWFLGCGAAIPFAAGTLPRAPAWMQRSGLEWLFRLVKEPRRLVRRYLIDGVPYAFVLLAGSLAQRAAGRVPANP